MRTVMSILQYQIADRTCTGKERMQDTATWPSMRRILIISLHLYRVSASTIRQTVRVFAFHSIHPAASRRWVTSPCFRICKRRCRCEVSVTATSILISSEFLRPASFILSIESPRRQHVSGFLFPFGTSICGWERVTGDGKSGSVIPIFCPIRTIVR
jgi:hypothetical protein